MWLKNLFGSKEEDEQVEEDNSFELKIQEAIKKCGADKDIASKEVGKMLGWAEDAIMDIYADCFENAHLSFYREKYREGLLDRYASIKEEYGSKIDPQMVAQCDKVVSGYVNQASLLMSKVNLFEKLENEHKQILEKFRTAKIKMAKLDKLNQHNNRLDDINSDTSHLSSSIEKNYELEEISREFEHKEEYFKQLEMLNQEFGSDEHFDNALNFKTEVDKMANDL